MTNLIACRTFCGFCFSFIGDPKTKPGTWVVSLHHFTVKYFVIIKLENIFVLSSNWALPKDRGIFLLCDNFELPFILVVKLEDGIVKRINWHFFFGITKVFKFLAILHEIELWYLHELELCSAYEYVVTMNEV
jgi:hypothetical protein